MTAFHRGIRAAGEDARDSARWGNDMLQNVWHVYGKRMAGGGEVLRFWCKGEIREFLRKCSRAVLELSVN